MIETYIIGDISNREAKIVGNFTARQALWGGTGVALSVVLMLNVLPTTISVTNRGGISFICCLPLFLIGFLTVYDMPLEKILPTLFLENFWYPSKRYYELDVDKSMIQKDFYKLPKKEQKQFNKKLRKDKYKSIYH